MSTRFPQTFASPALSSAIFCFLVGFFILLTILLAMVAFSLVVSLVVVSTVHVFCHIIRRLRDDNDNENDIEAGESIPQRGADTIRDHRGPREPGAARDNRQILEALERIIRELGEGPRQQRRERLREALRRLPPRVCYGSHETTELCGFVVKECVICLEDFEAGDLCQVFPMCNHFFHSSCIGDWLWKNPTCPLCRTCLFELESDCENE